MYVSMFLCVRVPVLVCFYVCVYVLKLRGRTCRLQGIMEEVAILSGTVFVLAAPSRRL